MLDRVESQLARWTGRASWPHTKAKIESRLGVPSGLLRGPRLSSSFVMVSYEIDGKGYAAAIREIGSRYFSNLHGHIMIQYDPEHPNKHYFGPACLLAGRAVVASMLVVGLAAVFFAFHWSH